MLAPGTILAGYRIDDVLGEGGMGVVYRATQLSLNRVVALKLLTGELARDEGFRTRFQREGQLQAALDHEHIVTVYEAGQTEEGLFIAMQLIEGPTLKDLILADQLDARRSLRLLAQVAQSLDAAHEAGLIHRDIKPQNILIGRSDHVYLADFGLTKAPDDTRLTSTGQFIGTIDYVAPEQARGEAATKASDCYSLAAVLYECLSGEVPYARPTETATVYAHLIEPPPRISEKRPDLPAALDDVIATGMAKDPAQRFSSTREMITAATRALASASPLASTGRETRLSPAAPGDDRREATRSSDTPAPAVAATALAGAAVATKPAAQAPAPVLPGEREARPATAPATRGRPLVYAVVLLIAVAAVAGGLLVGRSGKTASTAAFASSATVGHLQVRFPSSWQLAASSPNLPGIAFTTPIVLTAARSGAMLSAGEVDAGGPTLLPSSFQSRVQGSLPSPEPISLGSLEGYRYPSVKLAGAASPVTVYVVPSSAGVATVACSVPTGAASGVATQCAQIAATLRLVGATAYPLGPSPSYARLLSRTFSSLHAGAGAGLAALGSASTPAAQATAASRVAAAYTTAADQLRSAAISPLVQDADRAIATALAGIAAGYSRAAAAAAASSSAAFARAGQQIASSSTGLSAALHQLAGLGYRVGG